MSMTRRRRRERFHARRRHRGGLGGIFGVLGAGWPVAVLVLGDVPWSSESSQSHACKFTLPKLREGDMEI
jgi:hypothetical protein